MAKNKLTKRKTLSTYTLAYNAIVNSFKKKGTYLSLDEVRDAFCSVPELNFPSGTTVYSALEKLEGWGLVACFKPFGLEHKVVIPLSQNTVKTIKSR